MENMHRAYSLLSIKAMDEEQRIIEGIATTPTPDRIGDIVEPMGAKFSIPMPLLLDHDSRSQVGHVTFAKPTKAGIPFKAMIARVDEPGAVKDLVDQAWHLVKYKLRAAVSIGFRAMEDGVEMMKGGGLKFTGWEWLELSLVSVPANSEAVILEAKGLDTAAMQHLRTLDAELLAATGHDEQPRDDDLPAKPTGEAGELVQSAKAATGGAEAKPNPGDSGLRKRATVALEAKTVSKKTISEQIQAFEASRQAKSARMDEIMDDAAERGETLDASEKEEFDGLDGEVKEIDEHLVRLRHREKSLIASAKTVDGAKDVETASQTRSGVIVQSIKQDLPKGTAFTRYCIALARAKGDIMQAHAIADSTWKDSTPEVAEVLKTAVAAGTTTDSTWAGPLWNTYNIMASEFIELLRPATVIGRLSLRRVPFNIQMPRTTSGSSVGWVGEGAPKPVSAMAFDTVTLRWAKAAGIVVLTDELVRFSNPSAEAIVRQDLIDAMAAFLDAQFMSPLVTEVANVSPASVTVDVAPIVATGVDADAVRADVKSVFNALLAVNLSTAGCVWVMSERMALALSLMLNPLGQPEFPGISAMGGTFLGLPVVTSENVPANVTDPVSPDRYGAGDMIILVKQPEVMLADDGQVMVDASREASLQMDTTPANPADATTVFQSLWQRNLVALRAERWINWKKRRTAAVQYIAGANYGDAS